MWLLSNTAKSGVCRWGEDGRSGYIQFCQLHTFMHVGKLLRSLSLFSCMHLAITLHFSHVHTHLVKGSYVSSGLPASTLALDRAASIDRPGLLDRAETLLLLDLLFGIWRVAAGCEEELLDSARVSMPSQSTSSIIVIESRGS